jgi:hypothetical protein
VIKDLEREIVEIRAQARMLWDDQQKMLIRYLQLTDQADKLEKCLHQKRCLASDLKAIREHMGPGVTLVEDHGIQG